MDHRANTDQTWRYVSGMGAGYQRATDNGRATTTKTARGHVFAVHGPDGHYFDAAYYPTAEEAVVAADAYLAGDDVPAPWTPEADADLLEAQATAADWAAWHAQDR